MVFHGSALSLMEALINKKETRFRKLSNIFVEWRKVLGVVLEILMKKQGVLPIKFSQASNFKNFVAKHALVEIPIQGEEFTWSNNRVREDYIWEKFN